MRYLLQKSCVYALSLPIILGGDGSSDYRPAYLDHFDKNASGGQNKKDSTKSTAPGPATSLEKDTDSEDNSTLKVKKPSIE